MQNSIQKYQKEKNIHHAIIMDTQKSLLLANNEHWLKKTGDTNFGVIMESFDSAKLY